MARSDTDTIIVATERNFFRNLLVHAIGFGFDMTSQAKNNSGGFSREARLLADIGATHARFALEMELGKFSFITTLKCDLYSGITDLLRAFLDQHDGIKVQRAAIAISNPVDGDFLKMTNRNWAFSIEAVRQEFGWQTLLFVNGFTSLAMSLPGLHKSDLIQIGRGTAVPKSVTGVLGPGTGLGVAGLVPTSDGFVTLNSEGGHVNFAPSDEREFAIFQYAREEWQHVSAERIISGPGMELCYRALSKRHDAPPRTSKQIMQGAQRDRDALCIETLDCFCGMLGSFSGDLAVTLSAVGGIYVAGGIAPKMVEWLAKSSFRSRFEAKGLFSAYLAQIPTYVIVTPNPAFYGLSSILSEHLQSKNKSTLQNKIGRLLATLAPATRRLASLALEKPHIILEQSLEEIAQQAAVSQSTVLRFCRSLGFTGLGDFKLEFASSLTSTVSVRYLQKAQLELEELVTQRTEALRQAQLELEEIAFLDSLTGLPNRRLFLQRFDDFSAVAMRKKTSFGMLLIDLDKFKEINDTYGHDAGDAVLIATKTRLKLATRAVDVVARLGGDEFAVLLDAAAPKNAIEKACERITKMCAETIFFGELELTITVSIGAAIFGIHGTTQTELYKAADLALYEAKDSGRNTWRCCQIQISKLDESLE